MKNAVINKINVYLAIQTARAHERWIQRIWSVRCHQNFDIPTGIKTIQLVHDLKHRTRHLVVVPTPTSSKARAANRIFFYFKTIIILN